jgi:hypothetical protein
VDRRFSISGFGSAIGNPGISLDDHLQPEEGFVGFLFHNAQLVHEISQSAA